MKKNKMMRLASALLVAVLLTTCGISGTFAKYVTTASGSDTARVAKWGVLLTASTDVFTTSYDDGAVSVLADGKENVKDVIAPGTTGTATAFTISGTPEVDLQLSVTLGTPTMVTLPGGIEYTDYTKLKADGSYETFKLEGNYYPVQWKLYKDYKEGQNNEAVASGNLAAIQTYLTNTLSGKYDVETGAGNKAFSSVNGEYKLVWEWPYESTENKFDAADTYLGQIAAGVEGIVIPDNYVANESFTLTITATQLN